MERVDKNKVTIDDPEKQSLFLKSRKRGLFMTYFDRARYKLLR